MKNKYQIRKHKDDIIDIKLAGFDTSYLRLQKLDNKLYCAISTFVDPTSRGQGVGRKLYESLIDFIKSENAQFKATCPFVVELVQQDKENKKLYLG
jgi:predicted GNAT family acetyltransferase